MDETRLKRLRIRSWRRGTKEMDLILGPFADTHLAKLQGEMVDLYERLLEENDHDLYRWASGQQEAPDHFKELIGSIMAARPL